MNSDNTILQKLYHGTVEEAKTILTDNPKYKLANIELSEAIEDFKILLNDNLKSHLDVILKLQKEVNRVYDYENFAYGFKIGAGLLSEALTDLSNIPKKYVPPSFI